MHIAPDASFSVVALVWLPGQFTPVHDHIAWCVVGTYQGSEEEVRYRMTAQNGKEYLEETEVNVTPPGHAMFIVPPGDIHKVRNSADGQSVSVHVYGADIGLNQTTSIRRCYNHPVLNN
ncbi:MAG: cysteine dioxygenase family protein [Longispora sp.]|nr:cysteine dioxygenase family protein [Longispora sp. (in: high G+C Gram-positive bacteria)]